MVVQLSSNNGIVTPDSWIAIFFSFFAIAKVLLCWRVSCIIVVVVIGGSGPSDTKYIFFHQRLRKVFLLSPSSPPSPSPFSCTSMTNLLDSMKSFCAAVAVVFFPQHKKLVSSYSSTRLSRTSTLCYCWHLLPRRRLVLPGQPKSG